MSKDIIINSGGNDNNNLSFLCEDWVGSCGSVLRIGFPGCSGRIDPVLLFSIMSGSGNKINILSIIIAISIITAGCASGRAYKAAQELQPVNPHAALEYVAISLRDDPDDEDTLELLRSIIIAISHEHENRIESMIRARAYEEAIAQCDRVIASAYLVRTLPGGPYNLYYRENQRAELTGLAAEKAYTEGVTSQSEGDNRAAIDAFDRSLGLVDNYKDARARRDELLESVTTSLFITVANLSLDPAAARILASGVGATAISERPRFLKLAETREGAGGVCTIRIEDASFNDSGWIWRRNSRRVEVPKYDDDGKKIGTIKKKAWWTVYTRWTSYSLSAGFSVTAQNADEPAPSARASHTETSEVSYASWHGEEEGVPADVKALPSHPSEPKNRATLTGECAGKVAGELGHKLFLAYK